MTGTQARRTAIVASVLGVGGIVSLFLAGMYLEAGDRRDNEALIADLCAKNPGWITQGRAVSHPVVVPLQAVR